MKSGRLLDRPVFHQIIDFSVVPVRHPGGTGIDDIFIVLLGAADKGFDMVIRKSATLYIDPKYDVTDEVIAGLNKRYTKVEKK